MAIMIDHEFIEDLLLFTPRIARLDAQNASEFKAVIFGHDLRRNPLVVLNLQHVEFMDSTGLGAVVAIYKRVSSHGEFGLSNLTPLVEQLFELTRMNNFICIYDCYEDAQAKSVDISL